MNDAENNDAKKSALRSVRGHLSRLKLLLGQTNPAVTQHLLGIERGLAALVAPTVNDGGGSDTPPVHTRDPAHFMPNGRNLSDAGRTFISSLYDDHYSIRGAAARIGISLKAAADYRSAWLRRGTTEIS